MTTTGSFLKKSIVGKKIILVGSMIPLSGFAISDAGFNLGYAIGSFNSIDNGVYIATQGILLDPDNAHKNVDDLKFEAN